MSNENHTPGPWHVSTAYDEAGSVIAADGFPVAGVESTAVLEEWGDLRKPRVLHWSRDSRAFRKRADDEVWANARLIAAAPTMYAALKAVHACGNGGATLSRSASDKVRAALAAASSGAAK